MNTNNILTTDLPPFVKEICQKLNATPRLIAHLTLVHDVAYQITDKLLDGLPELKFDRDAVLFGAATHDIGKSVFTDELLAAGNKHEQIGAELLQKFGVETEKTRFTHTHASWQTETIEIEDLLVALADNCWKGKRNEVLENKITEQIVEQINLETWQVFLALDEILQEISEKADKRLAWQAEFSPENE